MPKLQPPNREVFLWLKEVIFMANVEKCSQQKIGYCVGCPILEIVLEKGNTLPTAKRAQLASKVSKELCPYGTKIQLPERRERPLM